MCQLMSDTTYYYWTEKRCINWCQLLCILLLNWKAMHQRCQILCILPLNWKHCISWCSILYSSENTVSADVRYYIYYYWTVTVKHRINWYPILYAFLFTVSLPSFKGIDYLQVLLFIIEPRALKFGMLM